MNRRLIEMWVQLSALNQSPAMNTQNPNTWSQCQALQAKLKAQALQQTGTEYPQKSTEKNK